MGGQQSSVVLPTDTTCFSNVVMHVQGMMLPLYMYKAVICIQCSYIYTMHYIYIYNAGHGVIFLLECSELVHAYIEHDTPSFPEFDKRF